MVAVGVLGEVVAWAGGQAVDLGTARQRCVLAVLAVGLNRVVPFERIVERVWGEDPPLRVRNVVSSYVSRLRGALAAVDGVELRHRTGGYVLEADESLVDLHRFRELRALGLFEQALGLWRGEALTGLGSDWALLERERLHGERFAVECDLVDARLDQGQGEELLAELTVRVTEHPPWTTSARSTTRSDRVTALVPRGGRRWSCTWPSTAPRTRVPFSSCSTPRPAVPAAATGSCSRRSA